MRRHSAQRLSWWLLGLSVGATAAATVVLACYPTLDIGVSGEDPNAWSVPNALSPPVVSVAVTASESWVAPAGVLLLMLISCGLAILRYHLYDIDRILSRTPSYALVTGLNRPLLVRTRSVVDRRFDRSRYDADRAVEEFAVRLRDEVDADQAYVDLHAVIRRTVAPSALGLCLPGGGS